MRNQGGRGAKKRQKTNLGDADGHRSLTEGHRDERIRW